jgi:hypothetical protein
MFQDFGASSLNFTMANATGFHTSLGWFWAARPAAGENKSPSVSKNNFLKL